MFYVLDWCVVLYDGGGRVCGIAPAPRSIKVEGGWCEVLDTSVPSSDLSSEAMGRYEGMCVISSACKRYSGQIF